MPAPKANLNSVRNGTHLSRLTLGELPQTMRRQLQTARKYRRALEAVTRSARPDGELTTNDAHLIDEAAGAEVHASVCRWLLKTRLDTMATKDVRACSAEVLKCRGIRNRAVLALNLDAEPSTYERLFAVVPIAQEPVAEAESEPDPPDSTK